MGSMQTILFPSFVLFFLHEERESKNPFIQCFFVVVVVCVAASTSVSFDERRLYALHSIVFDLKITCSLFENRFK